MSCRVELYHKIAVAELLLHADTKRDIIRDAFSYAPGIIYRIVPNLRQSKGIQKKAHNIRSVRIRTKKFIGFLKWSIAEYAPEKTTSLANRDQNYYI